MTKTHLEINNLPIHHNWKIFQTACQHTLTQSHKHGPNQASYAAFCNTNNAKQSRNLHTEVQYIQYNSTRKIRFLISFSYLALLKQWLSGQASSSTVGGAFDSGPNMHVLWMQMCCPGLRCIQLLVSVPVLTWQNYHCSRQPEHQHSGTKVEKFANNLFAHICTPAPGPGRRLVRSVDCIQSEAI